MIGVTPQSTRSRSSSKAGVLSKNGSYFLIELPLLS
jgi:hypothetical protein